MSKISVRGLRDVGKVDAEHDAILEYFLKTSAVQDLLDHQFCLVLGRKGSGKTALVRYFSEDASLKDQSRAISLKGYPWNVHAERKDAGSSEVDVYVASWRYLIAVELATLVINSIPDVTSPDIASLKTFIKDNYGGGDPELSLILSPPRLKLSKTSFEPAVAGTKLGGVNLERTAAGLRFGLELNALTDAILGATLRVADYSGLADLYLHFDELDQGIASIDATRTEMIIGLILAARSVRSFSKDYNVDVSAIVYLRTDLWQTFNFSDKNKITQSLALKLEWDEKSLRDLVDERLRAKLPYPNATFDSVEDGQQMRGSQPKFKHILARTFLRPRDVISFVNLILKLAHRRPDNPLLITNEDVVEARKDYSNYLKQELDDEIKATWPHWDKAVRAIAKVETITFERAQFETEYAVHRGTDTHDALAAIELLYEFSVVGYEIRSGYGGSGWSFKYEQPDSVFDSSAHRF